MGDHTPLMWAIAVLLFVGLIMPFIIGFFIDVDDVQTSPMVNNMTYIVENGFHLSTIPFTDWDDFNINPFAWLGHGLQSYLTEAIVYLSIFPPWFMASIVIMCITGIIYSLIKLLPTT